MMDHMQSEIGQLHSKLKDLESGNKNSDKLERNEKSNRTDRKIAGNNTDNILVEHIEDTPHYKYPINSNKEYGYKPNVKNAFDVNVDISLSVNEPDNINNASLVESNSKPIKYQAREDRQAQQEFLSGKR